MLRFKLDENFSPSLTTLFESEGFNAESVLEERLSGSPDSNIYAICQQENRCIVTFDLDFANILRFPAEQTPGIIVIRPNRPITLAVMVSLTHLLLDALKKNDPTGHLWILEPHQLRIRK
jgi:predicted nuclease of predicted toxin-antitoxin system